MLKRTCRPGSSSPPSQSSVTKPPAGPDWVHEIKDDGFRMLPRRDDERVRIFSDLNFTSVYGGAVGELRLQSLTMRSNEARRAPAVTASTALCLLRAELEPSITAGVTRSSPAQVVVTQRDRPNAFASRHVDRIQGRRCHEGGTTSSPMPEIHRSVFM